jgi:hypothetical protein
MVEVTFELVWKRIEIHSGEVFTQIRGGEFSYQAKNGYIILDRTNQNISQSDFEEAYYLLPLPNTIPVQHLRGPSYIYAILMDRRIRLNDW